MNNLEREVKTDPEASAEENRAAAVPEEELLEAASLQENPAEILSGQNGEEDGRQEVDFLSEMETETIDEPAAFVSEKEEEPAEGQEPDEMTSKTEEESAPEETEPAAEPDHPEEPVSSQNEIDEFTQKLLNRKTEMVLWPEDEPQKEEEPVFTPEERKKAEETMSFALDELRKSRGQVPIEEEEETIGLDQISFEDRFDGGEDFTTESLFHHTQSTPASEVTGKYETSSKDKSQYIEPTEKRPQEKSGFFRMPSPAKTKKPSASKAAAKPQAGKPKKKRRRRKLRKQAVALFAGIIAVILLLFGGYYYKTRIYDPANQITPAQQDAYNRLLAYAEEYSMSSDAERKELIDLEHDFYSLSAKQQEEINQKFVANTGKNFPDLLTEIKNSDGTVNSEDDPVYASLAEYVSTFSTMDEAGQDEILNKLEDYDSLSTALKEKINSLMLSQNGKNFMDNYNEVNNRVNNPDASADQNTDDQSSDSQNQSADASQGQSAADQQNTDTSSTQTADNSAEIQQYQNQINELTSLRDDYLSSLAEDGLSADGDDVVVEYNSQIAYWQALLNNAQ